MRVPFHSLPGNLDPVTKSAIQRNFQEIENRFLTSSTVFDATIDSSLASSNAGQHLYKNLGDCVTNETANMVSTRLFVIGVVGRQTPITETGGGAIALPGPISILCQGGSIGTTSWGQGGTGASIGRQQWDLAGRTVTGNFPITLQGLEIYNSGGSYLSPFPTSGVGLQMKNCLVSSTPPPYNAASRTITGYVCNGRLVAWDCVFQDMNELCNANGDALCWDCALTQYNNALTSNAFNVTHNLWFIGGVVSQLNFTNYSFTISGACNVFLDLKLAPNLGSSGGTLAQTMSITNAGSTTVMLNGYADLQPSFRATVAAGAGDCSLSGDAWAGVTISGNTNGNSRTVDIATDMAGAGGVFDITGPAKVTAQLRAFSGSNAQAILRGKGIRADLQIFGGRNPFLSLVGCTDSVITADLRTVTGGVQAYTIDGASARCVVILNDLDPNFSVASTNAGTNCLVIDEAGASGLPATIINLIVQAARAVPIPEAIPSEAEMEPWWMPVGSTGGGAAGAPGAQGPAGPQGAMAPQLAAEEPEEPWWFPVGFQKGDPGPQGPQGIPGTGGSGGGTAQPLADPTRSEDFEQWWQPVGPQVGATGSQGIQGIQGTQGPQGSKGDVILPDPTDDNAEPWWVMPGPGPQGQVGAQGVPGQQGVQGPAGSAPLPDTVDDNAEPWWLIPGPLAGPVGAQGPQGIPGTGGGGGGTAQPLAVEYDTDEPWWLLAGENTPPKSLLDEFLLHAAR